MKKLANLFKKAGLVLGCSCTAVLGSLSTMVSASDDASGAAINIDFDPSQMFTYSNVIISCLMPVVYITAGLSLGFTVIYALKSAFGNRM